MSKLPLLDLQTKVALARVAKNPQWLVLLQTFFRINENSATAINNPDRAESLT